MIPVTMRAWELESPRPIQQHPLRIVERPVPTPSAGELLVEVLQELGIPVEGQRGQGG